MQYHLLWGWIKSINKFGWYLLWLFLSLGYFVMRHTNIFIWVAEVLLHWKFWVWGIDLIAHIFDSVSSLLLYIWDVKFEYMCISNHRYAPCNEPRTKRLTCAKNIPLDSILRFKTMCFTKIKAMKQTWKNTRCEDIPWDYYSAGGKLNNSVSQR